MKWHSIRLQEIEFYIQFEFLHTTYYAVSSFVRFLSGPYIFCKVIYTHVTCYKLWFSNHIFYRIFTIFSYWKFYHLQCNSNQTFPFNVFVKGCLSLFHHSIDMRTLVNLSISCRKNMFLLKFSNKKHVFST